MDPLTIIKVGGAVIEEPSLLARLIERFSALPGRTILVHGGGRRATALAETLGVASRMVNGRRVTNKEMLDVVTMVYGGLVNKTIVSLLLARGLTPIGLTGADLGVITAVRRPPMRVATEAGTEEVDFGYVGDIVAVDSAALTALLERGITPVLAPLTTDRHGALLNTNADTIAAEVARALAATYAVTLVYAFEQPGVLRSDGAHGEIIPIITSADYPSLVATGVISGGMIPKVDNALRAVAHGVRAVRITSVDALEGGTTIQERL